MSSGSGQSMGNAYAQPGSGGTASGTGANPSNGQGLSMQQSPFAQQQMGYSNPYSGMQQQMGYSNPYSGMQQQYSAQPMWAQAMPNQFQNQTLPAQLQPNPSQQVQTMQPQPDSPQYSGEVPIPHPVPQMTPQDLADYYAQLQGVKPPTYQGSINQPQPVTPTQGQGSIPQLGTQGGMGPINAPSQPTQPQNYAPMGGDFSSNWLNQQQQMSQYNQYLASEKALNSSIQPLSFQQTLQMPQKIN